MHADWPVKLRISCAICIYLWETREKKASQFGGREGQDHVSWKINCSVSFSQFTGNKISISHLWHLKSYTQSTFLLDVSIIGPLLVLHATKIKQFLVLHMTKGATLLHHNLIRFTLARSLCHIQKAYRLHNSLMKSHLLLYLLKSHF